LIMHYAYGMRLKVAADCAALTPIPDIVTDFHVTGSVDDACVEIPGDW